MKIISLINANNGDQLFINFETVSYFFSSSIYNNKTDLTKKCTDIYFVNKKSFYKVNETPEQLMELLNEPRP